MWQIIIKTLTKTFNLTNQIIKMRTGFFTAALLAASVSANCHGDNCENSFAQIADQVSGAAKENILAQVGKMLADMPEEYFETMEGMLAQIESGDVDAP